MVNLRTIGFIFLAAALLAVCAIAQPTFGTLRGTMTDDSGAVIPAATITLTGGGATKTAQTQADGTYVFQGLAPGEYTVHVSFPGFAPVNQPVTMTAGGNLVVPIQMNVSAEKQEVTVKGEAGPSVSVEP